MTHYIIVMVSEMITSFYHSFNTTGIPLCPALPQVCIPQEKYTLDLFFDIIFTCNNNLDVVR